MSSYPGGDRPDAPPADLLQRVYATSASPAVDPLAMAALLDACGRESGDRRFIHAAGILRGKRGGRHARDDAGRLAQVADLLQSGTATTIEQAARWVARTMPGEYSTTAAAARLARKYRAEAK